MNYRTTLVVFASLLVLGAGNLASAQSDSANQTAAGVQDRGRGRARRGGFDRPGLNLTEDQKARLKSLHEGVRQQIEVLRNDATLSADDKTAKIRSLRESSRQQFQAVLTPEQQGLLQNTSHKRHERRGFGEGRGPRADLGLTPDQRTQLETIHKSNREQVNAIRSDSTMSSEQKEAKLKSLFQNSQQQVSGILTPEQQQKMRERRQRGAGRFGGRGHQRGTGVGSPPPAQP